MANEIVVDPEISRAKFARELDRWDGLAAEYGKRGIFITEARFPTVFAVFTAPQLNPASVVFGVALNFDNYDLSPPSVRFLNPFTREPYSRANLPEFLQRPQTPPNVAVPPGAQVLMKGPPAVMFQEPQGEAGEAFFCMQGVREYHSHPAHTGDPWVLHRGTGKGTLFQILDQLHEFGITILKGYNMNLQIQINGYQSGWPWQA